MHAMRRECDYHTGEGNQVSIYCDIDGTLTNNPLGPWGNPNKENIAAIRAAIANGHTVVLWSATGESYAKEFAKRYDISAHACLAKPDVCFDDHAGIRPNGKLEMHPPDQIISWTSAHGVPQEAK